MIKYKKTKQTIFAFSIICSFLFIVIGIVIDVSNAYFDDEIQQYIIKFGTLLNYKYGVFQTLVLNYKKFGFPLLIVGTIITITNLIIVIRAKEISFLNRPKARPKDETTMEWIFVFLTPFQFISLFGWLIYCISFLVFTTGYGDGANSIIQARLIYFSNTYIVPSVKKIEIDFNNTENTDYKIKPPILVLYNSNYELNLSTYLGSELKLFEDWDKYYFYGKNLNDTSTLLITKEIDYIFVIYKSKFADFYTQLDAGSVPAFRVYAEVFSINPLTKKIIENSVRIVWGEMPSGDIRGRERYYGAGGTTYISRYYGSSPTEEDIKSAIQSIIDQNNSKKKSR
jgi:hypothetical protein